MNNVRTIYADWYGGAIWSSGSGSQLAYQYDHLSNMVIFRNAPKLDNYYLIVEMKETEDGEVRTFEPIQLAGSFWLVPNSYTQLAQNISFQVCCKTENGDFERHSAQFTGTILPSKDHTGAALDIDPSIMFDPYKQWVSDIAMAAGAIVIDPTLSVQGAAADAKATGDAITDLNERLDEQEEIVNTLNEGGLDIKDDVIEAQINDWLNDHPEATTTVQDGAISEAKLASALKPKIMNAYITPEMYGAVGDGVTDDTSAINSCCATNQYVKFLPGKRYKITSSIIITDASNLNVDFNNCIIDSYAEQAIVVYNSSRISLKNLILRCNGNKGILFGYRNSTDRSGNTLLKDIQVYNAIEGFRFDGAGGYNYFIRCKCNTTPSNSVGFVIGENRDSSDTIGANYLYFDGCTYEGGPDGTEKCAMRIYHVVHLHVKGCDFCNIADGNAIELLCKAYSHTISFDGNSFWNNDVSIYVNATSLLFFSVLNNDFFLNQTTQQAIFVDSTSMHLVGGLRIDGNTFNGVSGITSLLTLRKTDKLIFKNNIIGTSALKPLYSRCAVTTGQDPLDIDLPMPKRVSNNSSADSFTVTVNYKDCLIQPRFNVISNKSDSFTWSIEMNGDTGVATITINPASNAYTLYFIEAYS